MSSSRETSPIPVTILAGFLGAGKTTTLNHLLSHAGGRRLAVIVNDFGGINIDQSLVARVDEDVISLENGCICCNISDDLVASVMQLTELPLPPEAIIVEASGVADPAAMAFTFSVAGVREFARLDSVVTLVDGPSILEAIPEEVLPLMESQVAVANLVIVNKSDLLKEGQDKAIQLKIRQWSKNADLIFTEKGVVSPEFLLGFNKTFIVPTGAGLSRHPTFDHWAFSTNRSIRSLPVMQHALNQIPSRVLRMKGILHLADSPFPYIVLHKVGRRVDFYPYEYLPKDKKTQLIALGLPGSLDKEEMDSWFEQCLV